MGTGRSACHAHVANYYSVAAPVIFVTREDRPVYTRRLRTRVKRQYNVYIIL